MIYLVNKCEKMTENQTSQDYGRRIGYGKSSVFSALAKSGFEWKTFH